VSLDGLIIIPLTQLIPLEFTFSIPCTSSFISLWIGSTVSELQFQQLQIANVEVTTSDACRSHVDVKISNVDLTFSGCLGSRVVLSLGSHEIEDVRSRTIHWSGQVRSSGRIEAALQGSSLGLAARLVQQLKSSCPKLELASSALDEGNLLKAKFDGFNNWGSIVTKVLPLVVGTSIWRWHRRIVTDYIIRKVMEGKEMDEMMKGLFELAKDHLDLESYTGLEQEERETAISTVKTTITPARDRFMLSLNLIGPTLLKSFLLADSSPELYRPGGTRQKLQSLNLLTEEIKLELKGTELRKIAFSRGSISFDSSTAMLNGGGGELVVSVVDLTAEVCSNFKIFAKTKGFTSWTTGIQKIGEKG
jgi:hypothetical protein